MTPTRRRYLELVGTGLAATFSGCTGGAPGSDRPSVTGSPSPTPASTPTPTPTPPRTDGGSDVDDTPSSEWRAAITAVDDDPDLAVTPSVELVDSKATADQPIQLRTTLTNTTDSPIEVGEGRAVHFEYVTAEGDDLIWLPSDSPRPYPAEPGCWRLTEGIAITEEFRILTVEPTEPSTRLVDLYGTARGAGCLPTGTFRFETSLTVLTESGAQEEAARWGFSIKLE